MSYQVKLDSFEGPLDLLLHLINKEEMDIYDIQISKITDQYLQFIETMQDLRLDIASEFLVMAATLLSIKSKMLLPSHQEDDDAFMDMDDEEEDPREELIQRLIEYKQYKEISNRLKDLEIERSQIFTRPPTSLNSYISKEEENPVEGISIYHLIDAFERALLKRSYRDPLTKIEREEISVKDRMNQIIDLLRENNGMIRFSEILSNAWTRSDIVVTFLSILELMKTKDVICIQSRTFDEIVIHYSSKERTEKVGLQ